MFRTFARDRNGTIAVLFAFALVPLLLVTGGAIEYSRSIQVQADLQSAVDGAALAAGRNALDQSRRDLSKQARDAFDAAFSSREGSRSRVSRSTENSERIAVEADATLPTIFGGFLGQRARYPRCPRRGAARHHGHGNCARARQHRLDERHR